VEITKTDAYDLIGRVVEIIPRRRALRGEMRDAALKGGATTAPPEQLHRIATGAALRVLA
jgi:hypothetical protein